jgi:hypothetical protein
MKEHEEELKFGELSGEEFVGAGVGDDSFSLVNEDGYVMRLEHDKTLTESSPEAEVRELSAEALPPVSRNKSPIKPKDEATMFKRALNQIGAIRVTRATSKLIKDFSPESLGKLEVKKSRERSGKATG